MILLSGFTGTELFLILEYTILIPTLLGLSALAAILMFVFRKNEGRYAIFKKITTALVVILILDILITAFIHLKNLYF